MELSFYNFLRDKNIRNTLISLLIAANTNNLSKSLVQNIIMPILDPIIPFFAIDYSIQYREWDIPVGRLFTDFLVFLINLYIVYLILVK